ncbi:ferric reductase-like transmembrane domain-containing protein [Marinobacter sp. SS13-12]|uniref:ferredoxin reductase family protein n=1 Tax=Marinobacter sp. SS13-12 TaxID=3050451 RepID=UPI002552C3B5|nr:ferric reductase-like transmembrane domain-containing protein [Marinobacter sp. SS13-12]MDK8465448.1 ferric reductase-like transmembrane domain-containing protein [Marinobacter sp. SS13-12]
MIRIILPFIILVSGLWAWNLAAGPDAGTPWGVYKQSLLLSGWLAIALMSLAMMLALRPAWLERPLGGLDKIYHTHKWAGILAVVFAAAHWLIEMGDDVIESVFGEAGEHEPHYSGFIDTMRDAAEDIGEFAIYLLFAMLLITLWRRFPYKYWRYLHRVMPALYLLLAFHAAWLAPLQWWQQPIGVLMAILLLGGSIASGLSLAGRVGRHRQVRGTITAINTPAPDVTEVTCHLGQAWRGHRAGQFAFVTFDTLEGAHPFTIASADRGDGRVTFLIKSLGDFTRNLSQKIRAGQTVTVEGPYGCFNFDRRKRHSHQIWIAGGIGVTPFLAWLEGIGTNAVAAPEADLHYCTRNADQDPIVERLREHCRDFPGIHLQIHDSSKGEVLSAEKLAAGVPSSAAAEVWFCGPAGLARAIRQGLRSAPFRLSRFHKEAFQFR